MPNNSRSNAIQSIYWFNDPFRLNTFDFHSTSWYVFNTVQHKMNNAFNIALCALSLSTTKWGESFGQPRSVSWGAFSWHIRRFISFVFCTVYTWMKHSTIINSCTLWMSRLKSGAKNVHKSMISSCLWGVVLMVLSAWLKALLCCSLWERPAAIWIQGREAEASKVLIPWREERALSHLACDPHSWGFCWAP